MDEYLFVWQIGGQRRKISEGYRREGTAQPLFELLDRESSGDKVLTKFGNGGVPIRIRRPDGFIGHL